MYHTAATPTAAHRAQQSIAGSYDTVVSYEPAIGATLPSCVRPGAARSWYGARVRMCMQWSDIPRV